mmetsp:Transcript_22541/g.68723  ORF Transcript_22541/g.68723 Transcript_22541/m.68723 type:complete len:214 (-) Transcript_22541:327-968(-)
MSPISWSCRTQETARLTSKTSRPSQVLARSDDSMSTHKFRPGAAAAIAESCSLMFSGARPPAYPQGTPSIGGLHASQATPRPIDSSYSSDKFEGGTCSDEDTPPSWLPFRPAPSQRRFHSGFVCTLHCRMNSMEGHAAQTLRMASAHLSAPASSANTLTSTPFVAVALIWKRAIPSWSATRAMKVELPARTSSTREEHRWPARRTGRDPAAPP